MIRNAEAVWKGSFLSGEGLVSTSSGIISDAPFAPGTSTWEEPCTSPTEMLVAAVASCTSLMVVKEMHRQNMRPEFVKTNASLTRDEKKGEWEITSIEVNITVGWPGGSEKKVQNAIKLAGEKCPIARALRVPITVKAKLHAAIPVAV